MTVTRLGKIEERGGQQARPLPPQQEQEPVF
jgi:hypothetical protein